MPAVALLAVLLAAFTHATWNLFAKRAASSRRFTRPIQGPRPGGAAVEDDGAQGGIPGVLFVWMYSAGSVLLYAPIVIWIVADERPHFGALQWGVLGATSVLHLAYSLLLQAGYRVSDLSLVYPIARGSGPLLAFVGAAVLLGERVTWLSALGLVLIVCGILLVAGLTREPHRAPRAGILFGLATGLCISAYTVNDGWAVKALGMSPLIVDYAGNAFRVAMLTPAALRTCSTTELRSYIGSAAVVSLLGPLGYILVLYAMRSAPISHVAPARELATLIGAYFGSRLLQERAGPERLVGAGLIVAGVVSLAFARS